MSLKSDASDVDVVFDDDACALTTSLRGRKEKLRKEIELETIEKIEFEIEK